MTVATLGSQSRHSTGLSYAPKCPNSAQNKAFRRDRQACEAAADEEILRTPGRIRAQSRHTNGTLGWRGVRIRTLQMARNLQRADDARASAHGQED
jgi:hypothetical protein